MMLIEENYAERPNKTRLKKIQKHYHDLAKQLIELTDNKLEKIPTSDYLRSAIIEGKQFKNKALKRQLKLIASLIGSEDINAIENELEQQFLPDKKEIEAFHQLEQWRNDLLSQNKTKQQTVLKNLASLYPTIEHQYINQLIRNSIKEQNQKKSPRSSRALFQYLKQLQKNK